jgi:hypothetical protein
MDPWLWLLWALAALVVLFVATAVFAAVVEGLRGTTRRPCPRCGYDSLKQDR